MSTLALKSKNEQTDNCNYGMAVLAILACNNEKTG
jgi:hypothetical protein